MNRIVTVWGKPYAVHVIQSSRTSFMAAGEFQGEKLNARAQSAAGALAAWSASAKSKIPRRA